MSNDLQSEWSSYQGVNIHVYENASVMLSYNDLYSIVCIEHYGEAIINFEQHTFSGCHLIFLCPEEIIEIKDCKKCSLVTISTDFRITENANFRYTFGNVDKCFRLEELAFFKIEVLYKELQQVAYNESSKLQEALSDILKECRSHIIREFNEDEFLLVYNFICLIHKHYKMHHEMSFYSKELGARSKYITEKFHHLGILPPHEYIKKRILVEAKRQLLYTNKNVKTICFDIGFNDPAYFSRFFKKNTGMTTITFKARNKTSVNKKKNVQ